MSKIFASNIFWITIAVVVVLLVILLLIFRVILPGIWHFLVINEPPQKSDVIIVLSGDAGRLEHGVALYQAGYADYLLLSGGAAGGMRQQAIALGVPQDHILLDRRSSSTFENARDCADIAKTQGFQSELVVTSAYHTRRSSIIFAEFFPRQEFKMCAVPGAPGAYGWWRDGHTFNAVIFEYLKLVWHYLFER
jgi:uncharacterized SAM-binding protein YcdF (DUF218 family)